MPESTDPPTDDARHALADRLNGHPPGTSLALAAVEDDPTLGARLRAAIAGGMAPPAVGDAPLYRRPAIVDAALAEWEADTAGGPCWLCGVSRRRRGRTPVDWRTPPTLPGFTRRDDGRAFCQWCADLIGEYGEDDARRYLFAVLVGLRGMGARHMVAPADGRRSETPFGYVDRDALVAYAREHYDRTEFVRARIEAKALPGIAPLVHDPADLPPKEHKVLVGLCGPDRSGRSQAERAAKERARRDARRQERTERLKRQFSGAPDG